MSSSKNQKSTEKNRKSPEDDFLDLTDTPDFVSMPPEIPLWANIKLCEEMLSTWNRNRFQYPKRPLLTEEFYL